MQIGGVASRGGRGSSRRKPEVAASRAKGRRRCESEVDRRPCLRRIVRRESKRIAEGRAEARNSRRKPEVRIRSSRTIQRRSEPGSWPPVEPECGTADASRGFSSRRSQRMRQPAKAGESAAGGAGGRSTGCTTSSSRLKRQGLRSLAFSIYGHFCPKTLAAIHAPPNVRLLPLTC